MARSKSSLSNSPLIDNMMRLRMIILMADHLSDVREAGNNAMKKRTRMQ